METRWSERWGEVCPRGGGRAAGHCRLCENAWNFRAESYEFVWPELSDHIFLCLRLRDHFVKLSALYLMGFKPYFASKLGPWQVPGAMSPPSHQSWRPVLGCLLFASHFLGQKIKEALSFELESVRAGAR